MDYINLIIFLSFYIFIVAIIPLVLMSAVLFFILDVASSLVKNEN